MRVMIFVSMLLAGGLSASAQTNAAGYAEPGADTNSPGGYSLTETNGTVTHARVLSLQDCVQMALQHNLDLQIDRYDPQVALFALRAAYGGYDVSLSMSGQHDHNEGVPSIFGTNTIPGTIADNNTFASSLGGVSPLGATYSLQGNANEDYGSFPKTSSSSVSGTASQPLLKNFWIDNTRLSIRVGRNRLKYSELGLKLQIMTIVTSVEQA